MEPLEQEELDSPSHQPNSIPLKRMDSLSPALLVERPSLLRLLQMGKFIPGEVEAHGCLGTCSLHIVSIIFSSDTIRYTLLNDLIIIAKNGLGQGNNTTVAHPTVLSGLAGKTVTQISAGDYFGVATTSNNEVYVWGAGAAFCNPKLEYSATPVELTVVTDYLRDGGYTIKSVKASGDSVMILTKCGHLFGWGGNYFGQIANGHDKLHIRDREVYRPTEVVKNYTGTIRNFDLSEDLCVMYTGNQQSHSNRCKQSLLLRKIPRLQVG